jgi:glycosyltransferase involved in cell wall biosynthesis
VIPAYNAADTIEEALRSVLAQTYAVSEIIVVDDGSTDATTEIVQQFAPEVRLIKHHHGGPSSSRNAGMQEATGNWIAFLDDDDVWHKEKLERQLAVLQSAPYLDLLATNWTRGDLPEHLDPATDFVQIHYFSILTLNRFQTSTVVARTTSLRESRPFQSELDGVEDWDFWLHFAEEHQLAVLEQPLVIYRDSPDGVSKDLRQFYRTMRIMLTEVAQDSRIDPKLLQQLQTWHQLRLALAFALQQDFLGAKTALYDLHKSGLYGSLAPALRHYFLPFALERARRRRNR